ncbi:alpha/beta fold hydrolase [Streptomyces griseofuscus]|uniref:alpha/beta fold hydrolase n=1 Tax=Streptomyces griseofuscus TaxID=146922 RepID=UPI00340DFB12
MWAAHLPLLADGGVRPIALDLPGHGEALVTDGREVTPWTDVLDTLTHLGIDRFVLAGNSLGALVALQAAVTAPERVEGLLLVGYRPHEQPASPRLQAAWEAERAALDADDLDAAVAVGVEAWTSADATDEVRAHAARMLRGQLTGQLAHGEPSLAEDPLGGETAALRTLRTPALVAVGEHDMPDFFDGGRGLARDLDAGEPVVRGHPRRGTPRAAGTARGLLRAAVGLRPPAPGDGATADSRTGVASAVSWGSARGLPAGCRRSVRGRGCFRARAGREAAGHPCGPDAAR